MVLDDKGRIIVSESHTYRYGPPGSPIKPFANPVVRLDPDGKGGFTRTLIADGFTDPVMGIAIKGDKLWLSACQYLYTYDIDQSRARKEADKTGLAINKKTIVTDLNKAWNPFGMFVLEWGPDGKLYMSVGNHAINLQGPDAKLSARGSSGMIMRMNPDGTKMERLVHGLRVPYSFEMDPFGQLWLLSNGEGNPDRFVRVIDGVDYHCYSRGVDNEWLAGRHPLAPPCEEVHGGAHTQLMRYYAANFPQEYQGNLFACNWGRHGFAGANRGIFRFVLDERNNVVKKDTLVACADPHFRPSHIHLDVDGSLLIADWYGRDDESDMTGRIWRLKYVGKDRPKVDHTIDSFDWARLTYCLPALGSPDHRIREKATYQLTIRKAVQGLDPVPALKAHAAKAAEPLGAANALWTLLRINSREALDAISAGTDHPDWRVRRLAINLMRRYNIPGTDEIGRTFNGDKDPAVCVAAAAARTNPELVCAELIDALQRGAAHDQHLRYEVAFHFAKNGTTNAPFKRDSMFYKLLTSDDADIRLAGLIAVDIACYENFASKENALMALRWALEEPGKLDHQLLLTVAQLDGDASIVPALEKLIARDDLPTATIAKAVLVMKSKAGGLSSKLSAAAGKRLIEAVEKGTLPIKTAADQLVIFEFLEAEGPTPFALKQISGQLQVKDPALKQAAHTLARRFGPNAPSLAVSLWPRVFDPKTKFEDTLEYLSTIARVETKVSDDNVWTKLLEHEDPYVRMEAVRWWRIFPDRSRNMVQVLTRETPKLIAKDERIKEEIETVLRGWQPGPKADKDQLTKYAAEEIAKMPAADRAKRAAMGLQVFERNACTKCHTTATATTLLAPSLKGVAQQKVEYLIESVLYPSKIIKTGWEVEQIETKSGKTLVGLVKDEGKHLRVLNLDKDERVLKTDVESRSVSKISVMPEGQEATLSRREFVDLIAYLQTLK